MVADKCWKTFDEKLAAHKWLMAVNHYKTHKAKVQTEMYERRMSRFAKGNDERLSTHFRTAFDRCATSYKARKQNLAMPVSENDLEAEHRQVSASIRDLLDEQAGAGGELKDTPSYQGAQNSLSELLQKGSMYAQQKNVELWKVHSDEATRCALAMNDEVMRRCGLSCLFNKVPAVHKTTSQKHLVQCFPRSGAGSRMSPSMQLQVFNDWYSKDLAHDSAMVWNNFYMGTMITGAVVLFLLSGYCRGCCDRQPPAPYYDSRVPPVGSMGGRF